MKNGDSSKSESHLNNKCSLDIDSYFFNIDESKLHEMEIAMGLNTTDAEKNCRVINKRV